MSQQTNTYRPKLQGARVLILGGSSGVGFGVAQALLELGAATVIISSSSQDRLTKAVDRLKKGTADHSRIVGLTCDLGSQSHLEANVENLVDEVLKGGQKLDHVVYTAGDTLLLGNFEEFSLAQMQQAGMVRFFGPLVVAKHLRKLLKGGNASSFILTTGGTSQRPAPGWTVVNSYITGLEGMTRGLARDLAPMRVNVVGLGPVETELWDAFKAYGITPESYNDKLATGVVGKVEDAVESYLYLMKDKNTTGTTLISNGGMLLME